MFRVCVQGMTVEDDEGLVFVQENASELWQLG